jgi:uncharacterized protein (DUF2237 family)
MLQISTATKNVLGGPLSTCSKPGYALTGFTRDGHCVDMGDDDAGSHHICIQMKPDFCTVTGQPNWCGEKMECMNQAGMCPIGNWCVCQWAFARYIKMAGGCNSIVDIECDSTNMAALNAYRSQASSDPTIQEALECLEQRCSITSRLYDASVPSQQTVGASVSQNSWITLSLAGCAFVLVALAAASRSKFFRTPQSTYDAESSMTVAE